MDTSNFYIPLETKCSITKELLEFAEGLADDEWELQRGFLVTMIPDQIIDKDPYLKAVKKKYKVLQVMVCLPPHTCYPWHKDLNRRTIINMPLNGKLGVRSSKVAFFPPAMTRAYARGAQSGQQVAQHFCVHFTPVGRAVRGGVMPAATGSVTRSVGRHGG